MISLKKVIGDLEASVYEDIAGTLKKNKADNFLYLLKSYRNKDGSDSDIIETLGINKNSFYVLKSRLYEKIQQHITGSVVNDSEEVMRQMQEINEKCFNGPRAIAIAFLQKLEKDLLLFDMHYELRIVYAALKKMHLHSEKYFHYSQLYNKQIALGVSLEKCEELLGDFNRILGQYHFSRSKEIIEKLLFLKKETTNHYQLNPSRQIAFIQNIMDLQLYIFCRTRQDPSMDIGQLFRSTQQILEELPPSSHYKKRDIIIDYLYFEYYLNLGDVMSAGKYFEKVNPNINHLLLYTCICNTSRFMVSKVKFMQLSSMTGNLAEETTAGVNFDPEDTHSKVLIGIYNAMQLYYSSNLKQAVKQLVDLINLYSFKDFFHINLEVKLTLAFFYIKMKDSERAEFLLNTLSRKIKTEKLEQYNNALNIIKLFNEEIDSTDRKSSSKQKDLFTIFNARNNDDYEILQHLIPELKLKYS